MFFPWHNATRSYVLIGVRINAREWGTCVDGVTGPFTRRTKKTIVGRGVLRLSSLTGYVKHGMSREVCSLSYLSKFYCRPQVCNYRSGIDGVTRHAMFFPWFTHSSARRSSVQTRVTSPSTLFFRRFCCVSLADGPLLLLPIHTQNR